MREARHIAAANKTPDPTNHTFLHFSIPVIKPLSTNTQVGENNDWVSDNGRPPNRE